MSIDRLTDPHEPFNSAAAELFALLAACEPYLTEGDLALMVEFEDIDYATDYAIGRLRAQELDPDDILNTFAA